MEARVQLIYKSRPMTVKKLNTYWEKTVTDKPLKFLVLYILHKWPEKQKVKTSVKAFYISREGISMLNVILLKGNRIIVPTDQCGEVWNLIHRDTKVLKSVFHK